MIGLPGFLRDPFWQGFIAGSLFIILVRQVIAFLPWLVKTIRKRLQLAREKAIAGIGSRLRNDIYSWAQHQHLAAVFFPLDEILIPPQVLAPPSFGASEEAGDIIPNDVVSQVIPYLPDWPQMAALYGAPTLTLIEALDHDANLILLGHPGIGKTVALAYIASIIARKDPSAGKLAGHIPLLIHIADLLPKLEQKKPPTIVAALCAAISAYASRSTIRQLPNFLKNSLGSGKIILLVDGYDEASPGAQEVVKEFLQSTLQAYPNLRVIVTAIPGCYSSLNKIGLIPVALASWSESDRFRFIKLWQEKWLTYGKAPDISSEEEIDPLLSQSWLLTRGIGETPLELTLRLWGALAGDLLAPDVPSLLEAHLRRLTTGVADAFSVLERLSVQMITNQKPVVALREAEKWVNKFESSPGKEAEGQAEKPSKRHKASFDLTSSVSDSLYRLENGILIQHSGHSVRLFHSVFMYFLAGRGFSKTGLIKTLIDQDDWSGKHETLAFVGCYEDITTIVQTLLGKDLDPTHTQALTVARWLRFPSKYETWRNQVMRYLMELIQKENVTMGMGGRVLSALALSGDPGVTTLFRQFLKAKVTHIKQLGALGCGMVFDSRSLTELGGLFLENDPIIGGAACLAMVAIGTKQSLETVMALLLHGTEPMRRAAAEALGNNEAEGHPALEEGSTLPDLLVRRAVVYGLMRIRQSWALKLLEKMEIEDAQWVVRTAALQALEDVRRSNPYIPRPVQELTELPWLVEFAAKAGMGVTPGKPALDLLIRALEAGEPRERIQALEFFRVTGLEGYMPQLYQTYYGSQSLIRETAFNTLWHFAAAGIPLPPPIQYGFS